MSEPQFHIEEFLAILRGVAEEMQCDHAECEDTAEYFTKPMLLHLVAETMEYLVDPRCVLCGADTEEIGEYYMVTEELWEAHGVPNGRLCIGCLEQRLGRELNPEDFTDVLLNTSTSYVTERSDRLKTRMGKAVVDWQVAMVSLFGSMDEVEVSTSCPGPSEPKMVTEAIHLKTGLKASVEHGRSKTSEEAGQRIIEALEKLHAVVTSEPGINL